MNWQSLNHVPTESFLPKALQEQGQSIDTEVDALLAKRAAVDSEADNLRSVGVEDPQFLKALTAGRKNAEKRFALVGEEIALRRKIDAFLAARHEALAVATDEAHAAMEKAEATITAKLEKLGYLTPVPGRPIPGAWTPEFPLRHPAVIQAREEYRSLHAKCDDNALQQANAAALHAMLAELERMKARALAV